MEYQYPSTLMHHYSNQHQQQNNQTEHSNAPPHISSSNPDAIPTHVHKAK